MTAHWKQFTICLLLVAVAFCLFAGLRGLHKASSWDEFPGAYSGDNIQILTWFKAASEGSFLPVVGHDNPRLGFPTGSNWNDFPQYHQALIVALGQLTRAMSPVRVAHLAMVLACVTSCLGFYVACRLMRWHSGLSFGLSLAYGFSMFGACKGLGHVFLTFVGIVPLCLICSFWLLKLDRLCGWQKAVSIAVAIWCAQGDTYTLAMWGLILVALLCARIAGGRQPWTVALVLAVTVGGFFLSHAATFTTMIRRGYNKDVNPIKLWHAEMFSLKPAELVIPPATHRWSWARKLAERNDHRTEGVLVRGELHAPYLGAVGVVGLTGVLTTWFVKLAKRQPAPLYGSLAILVFAFAILGGGNFIACLFGLNFLRATARQSVWLHTLALLFLVGRLSWWTVDWPAALRWLLGLGLGVFSVWDCYLPFTGGTTIDQRRIANDQAFGHKLDVALSPDAGVFVLPPERFPDAVSLHNLRPYLWSTHGRFTSGQVFGRPETKWHLDTAKRLSVPELKAKGFAAVLFVGGNPNLNGESLHDEMGEQHLILLP